MAETRDGEELKGALQQAEDKSVDYVHAGAPEGGIVDREM